MAILPLQLARVSNLLRTNIAQQTISRTQQSLLAVQNQLSTGKKIISPSDNAGQAAIAQQLRKTLEQREAFASNLKQAGSHLGEVDSSLQSLNELLVQAQTIASANVGSDVTPEQRESSAAVIDSILRQVLNVGNRQFDGVYIFGGDRSTEAPFVETGGGVKYVGSRNVLSNVYDESTVLPFMADGEKVFGALSTRIEGTADLTPALTTLTRLSDVRGAAGEGIRPGSFLLSNGATSATVDLTGAQSVADVINRINAAGVGGITASVAPNNLSLRLTGAPGDNISVSEIGGGTTASDLGIVQPAGAGAGLPLNGSSVAPKLTSLTPLADLKAGAGIDLADGLRITNGLLSATVTFSSPPLRSNPTVEDLINAINGSGTAVRAEINASRDGINIYNPTQGTNMSIAENGGSSASDLGVRSFSAASPLSELNGGKGVRTVAGNDIQIIDTNGVTFGVDLDGLQTIQDVIDAINNAAAAGGAGVFAGFLNTGNGITIQDAAGGTGPLSLAAVNFSTAAADLGLDVPAVGTTITGRDTNPVTADGIFAHIAALSDALRRSDNQAITAASEGLHTDAQRVVQIRGQTGARVQEIEARQQRLDDQNLATQALLSSIEDTDFTEAISRFQTLQTAFEASLRTSARVLDLSLLDFLR